MKNKKLLVPLVAVASLGVTVAPMLAMVSCGDKNPTTSIAATYNGGASVYPGTVINKADFTVIGTKKDGTKFTANEWTCSKFLTSNKYVVSSGDETVGHVDFEIVYDGKKTTASIGVNHIEQIHFLYEQTVLYESTNTSNPFTSAKEVYMWAGGGLGPQWVSAEYFDFRYFEEDGTGKQTEITEDVPVRVVKAAASGAYVMYISKTDYDWTKYNKHYIKAFVKGGNTALATTEVKIQKANYLANFYNQTAEIEITNEWLVSGDETATLVIPEYLIKDGAYHSTVRLLGNPANTVGIKNVVIPKSVTTIDEKIFFHNNTGEICLQGIVFLGTSAQWENIQAGENWQGNVPLYAYCVGDEQLVKFNNRFETDFVKVATRFGNKPAIIYQNGIGSRFGTTKYVMQFNLSEILPDTGCDYKKMKVFEAVNTNRFVTDEFKFGGFYINGKALSVAASEDEDGYREDSESGAYTYKCHLTNKVVLNEDDVITVSFETPRFSQNSIYIALHETEA